MPESGTIPHAVRHVCDSLFHRRRARNEEPTTELNPLRAMVEATMYTVKAPLCSALNDAATPARIVGSGEGEAGDNASPHSAGHARSAGSDEGRETNVNATLPSGSGRMEGHVHTDGRGGNDGPQAQYFTIVINMTNTGGIGGPGGAGPSVGGRGGDGGGASILGVPPPTWYSIHSTDDASLGTTLFGGDRATGEGSVIGVHAVHPAHTVDDVSLGTVGRYGETGGGSAIGVHAQTTTTRSIGICSTPPPLPVDDASPGTVGGHDETGEGPVIDVHSQITTTRSLSIRSTPPSLPAYPARTVDDAALGIVGATDEGSVIGVQEQITTHSIGILSAPCPLPAHPAPIVDDAALGTVGGDGGPDEGPVVGQAQIITRRSIDICSTPLT
ncbi:hypothetical protein C8J57DRAFT_1306120 [Mycena rebaudengoi]|nr:hypothetical protein C8J57DRAFT_1306120 [Mycena rebaudengoi]